MQLVGVDTGHTYNLKTNDKGEYFSLGILPGKYNFKLSKDGTEIFHINDVTVGLDESGAELRLEEGTGHRGPRLRARRPSRSRPKKRKREKAAKDNNTVKALNDKITEADAASTAGDFEKAIATLNDAIAIDNTRDLIWFKLGDAYRDVRSQQTDPDEKKKRYETAVTDYQKAIDLRKASEQAAKDPDNNKKMAAYYNNLAEAYPRKAKWTSRSPPTTRPRRLTPDNAAQYNFNEGTVLTNAGKADEAKVAFDKVIAADPNKALAYYWKGINLIGKATVGKDNKMVAPDGTAQAFQKYIELDPNGPMAQTAKDMLASIGATVETGFGTKKKSSKK